MMIEKEERVRRPREGCQTQAVQFLMDHAPRGYHFEDVADATGKKRNSVRGTLKNLAKTGRLGIHEVEGTPGFYEFIPPHPPEEILPLPVERILEMEAEQHEAELEEYAAALEEMEEGAMKSLMVVGVLNDGCFLFRDAEDALWLARAIGRVR
jgi:hypothetical protein